MVPIDKEPRYCTPIPRRNTQQPRPNRTRTKNRKKPQNSTPQTNTAKRNKTKRKNKAKARNHQKTTAKQVGEFGASPLKLHELLPM